LDICIFQINAVALQLCCCASYRWVKLFFCF